MLKEPGVFQHLQMNSVMLLARCSARTAYQYAREGCSVNTLVGRMGSFFRSSRVRSSLKISQDHPSKTRRVEQDMNASMGKIFNNHNLGAKNTSRH